MSAFASLYQREFGLSESEHRLLALALQYIDETETYDRTVCTGPILHDGVMPATRHQFALANRNARQTMDRLCNANPEFSDQQIRRAVSRIDSLGRTS
ncbi:hypothetical protein A7J50_4379 [Pseudomonas antarctica]|uniref:Uncharacterized protein n=1 Tax=Pseudomonas antarctica TaxID=219572 RepID=A0A172Z5G8_9PSED|nr:hypothetical protein A7J50_4379 [Pseudomonas antarctica]